MVFDYVADVAHLPDDIPEMVTARPQGENVHVEAEVEGRHEEGDATFRADPDRRRIEWGTPEAGRYHGWLQVAASGADSTVTIYLTTQRNEDAEQIERSLAQALKTIADRTAAS